ncbi:MAG: universal stress protein [Cryomorphaceae bacterium]|nr:universal stress protein [Flavobacteriales bacterium]
MKKPILVPTDFTKVADTAINHAIHLAKAAQTDVYAVHIVEDRDDVEEGRKKMKELKAATKKRYDFKLETVLRIGSIKDDIADLALEIDAAMVVLGTSGLRGFQWIFGSGALKIGSHSRVPFIVVQEKEIAPNGYDDILVPLDLNKETKQKLSLVADAAKYFSSRVHLLSPHETDEFLFNQLDRNIKYASNYFEEKGIAHTVKISSRDSGDFDDAILEYAEELDVDLISIMNLPGSGIANLIGGNFVQNIITNKAHIPVLLLNPRSVSDFNIFSAYMGRG